MKVRIKAKISDKDFNKLRTLRLSANNSKYEEINGVILRKSRTNSVATVNHMGVILKVEGANPRNLVVGENIYEM